MAANQATAVANLRTLISASVSYSVTYANGYPPTLGALGGIEGYPGHVQRGDPNRPDLCRTHRTKRPSYQYTLTGDQGVIPNPPVGCTPGFMGYLQVQLRFLSLGLTGKMSYCSEENGVLHYDVTGVASASAAACDALPTIQ